MTTCATPGCPSRAEHRGACLPPPYPTCTRCEGTGEVEDYRHDGEVLRLICPICDGTSVVVR